MIQRPCIVTGCLAYTSGTRCDTHAAQANAERMADPYRIYNQARWRRLRAEVLADHPLCRYCNEPATDVDHIRPIRQGGNPWDRRNLQPMCHSHHSQKTAAERSASSTPPASTTSTGIR